MSNNKITKTCASRSRRPRRSVDACGTVALAAVLAEDGVQTLVHAQAKSVKRGRCFLPSLEPNAGSVPALGCHKHVSTALGKSPNPGKPTTKYKCHRSGLVPVDDVNGAHLSAAPGKRACARRARALTLRFQHPPCTRMPYSFTTSATGRSTWRTAPICGHCWTSGNHPGCGSTARWS